MKIAELIKIGIKQLFQSYLLCITYCLVDSLTNCVCLLSLITFQQKVDLGIGSVFACVHQSVYASVLELL